MVESITGQNNIGLSGVSPQTPYSNVEFLSELRQTFSQALGNLDVVELPGTGAHVFVPRIQEQTLTSLNISEIDPAAIVT
ncbi:MAG: hypothetical protein ABIH69_07710 [bacterium]